MSNDLSIEKLAQDLEQILYELDETTFEDMSYDELVKYRKELNPYGRVIEGSDKFLTFSYTNLTEHYHNRLNITALIGYLNRACDEWHVPDGIPVIPVYEYAKNPESVENFAKDWKLTDKIRSEIEENKKWMEKRLIVKEFLEEMFQYNPDEHVRSAYKPQPKDKERKVINTPAANLAIAELKQKDVQFREQMLEFDRVQNLMSMSKSVKNQEYSHEALNRVAERLVLPEQHYSTMDYSTWSDNDKNLLRNVYEMIPPDDIFHKFLTYRDVNYDKLREAVQYLYCDKPDFDIAFCPHQWHDNENDAVEFQKKHRNEVTAEIYKAESGKWNFVAPFAKVRDTMTYFNDSTIVLEEILKQSERDAKLGQDLMKKATKKKKLKNIEEAGPDDEDFLKWAEQNSTLKDLGAEKINADSYADDECGPDEIQVDVFRISEGGLKLKKDKFFTKAEAPTLASGMGGSDEKAS